MHRIQRAYWGGRFGFFPGFRNRQIDAEPGASIVPPDSCGVWVSPGTTSPPSKSSSPENEQIAATITCVPIGLNPLFPVRYPAMAGDTRLMANAIALAMITDLFIVVSSGVLHPHLPAALVNWSDAGECNVDSNADSTRASTPEPKAFL